MGDPEGWPQPSGLLPEGSSSSSYAALFSSLEDERWLQAEDRTVELITRIQPTQSSEERRRAVADYVQRLIRRCFTCEVFTFGSVPLKTYLPDGDIDLTAFSRHPHLKETWANEVRAVLEDEERSKRAEFRVKEVQYIQAEVKIIKCLVENIVVDISFNQLGGLCTLCFLEEVDRLIGQDHLFKRSIILVKAWCYYESRILGAHHGLISTYALETLVLYIFHVFHASLRGPLGVLFRFLEFFSNFDWDRYCVSLWGPVPLSALPDMPAEPPRRDGGKLLLSKAFLDACAHAYAVFPGANDVQVRAFSSKYLNVIDPLRTSNNLGRSVSKGNFFRIRSAFSYGARKLARILECPQENVVDELDKFFLNTWDRHGSGRRPDAPEPIERLSLEERAMVEDVETNAAREEENSADADNFEQFDKKAFTTQSRLARAPTIAGEHLKELSDSAAEGSRSQHSDELARSFSRSTSDPSQHHQNRSRSSGIEMHTAEVGLVSNHVGSRKSFLEMDLSERQESYNETVPSPGLGEKGRVDGDRSVDEADDLTTVELARDVASRKSLEKLSLSSTDLPTKIAPPSLWGNASPLDVPAFYPRARPVQTNHSDDVVDIGTEDVPATSHSHLASSNRHPNVAVPLHLPVHGAVSPTVAGPPPPPLGIHSASALNESSRPPGFGSQSGTYLSMPLLRGPVPPPLPPYGPSGLALSQRVLETGNEQSAEHTDENWQERDQLKDAQDFSEPNRLPPSFKFPVPGVMQASGPYGHSNPTRNGNKELSPEVTVCYEQNGVSMEDEEVGNTWHGGEQLKGKGTFQSGRAKAYKGFSERGAGKLKAGDERVGDGTVEPWPVMDPALLHYSQMFSQGAASNPGIYPGLIPSVSLSDGTAPVSPSTSSDASSPVPYPLPPAQRPVVTSQSQTQPSVGVPVGPSGFLRATSTSSDTAGVHSRKQRSIDNQAAPSFYYSASIPFTYVPVYNSFPVYVLPPEGNFPVTGAADSFNEITGLEEDSQGVPQLICGVGERLSAAGIPVRAGARVNTDRFPAGSVGGFDLLSSDFAIHLRNLDYGRTCLVPSFIPQPIFPPFAKELQGHHMWEGPGRPVHANMNPLKQAGHGPGSSRLPRGYRAFPGPPGFHGEEVSKPRAGTGTYLPGARHGHRDRQFRSQHDGYQEHTDYMDREGSVPPRYQRGMSRGQNSRMTQNAGTGGGKAGDKGWHDSYNRNSIHALPMAFSSGHPSVPAGAVLTPAQAGMNLDVYSQAYMNGNGNSPTGPLVVVYPYGNANEALEFGSLGPMQLGGSDLGASRGSLRSQMQTTPYAGNDRQQPSSPKNQQRPTQLTYQLKEEDFPPLSFRGQGGSTSTASNNTGTRSSPYQTYVASQS